MPSFVTHDKDAGTLTIQSTSDSSLEGDHSITVTYTVTYRTSPTEPLLTEDIQSIVQYNLKVLKCAVGDLTTSVVVPDQVYNIGDPEFRFGEIDF